MKPYGFMLRIGESSLECTFNPRDWGLLTAYCSFSEVAAVFQNAVGLNALSNEMARERHTALVYRRRSHFQTQIEYVLSALEEEEDALSLNYQVERARYQVGPERLILCKFMGHDAVATGGSGHCTLELSQPKANNQRRTIGRLDLRPFDEFAVDDDLVIKIRRRKAKEQQISGVLKEIVELIDGYGRHEEIAIELYGGGG